MRADGGRRGHDRFRPYELASRRGGDGRDELARGEATAARPRVLVNSGPVALEPSARDHDVYGRKLRVVKVAGVSVGGTLVHERLARWYGRGRRP